MICENCTKAPARPVENRGLRIKIPYSASPLSRETLSLDFKKLFVLIRTIHCFKYLTLTN